MTFSVVGGVSTSYEDFPRSTETAPGMKSISAVIDEPLMGVDINVPYAHKDGQELHIEVLYPRWEEPAVTRYPLIMYIQGSAWRVQPLGREIPQLLRMVKRGYVIAIIEYRHSGIALFPAQVKDAYSATRFMLKNADLYHIDPEYVYMWGHSSGGHTAAMVNFTQGMPEFTDEPEAPELPIRGYIDYFGPSDLLNLAGAPSAINHTDSTSHEGALIGGKDLLDNPQLATWASPIHYISPEKDIRPMLLVHGDKDRLVPFHHSVQLYNALRAAGKSVELYRIENADHSIHPSFAAFFSDQMLDILEEFIHRV